ncbi:MAG TPA: dephospho-CoA kinase [Pyrinomonadaceae bacterium]|nr:dephospho-CoA kinase [Pyrinomonadaceae bacterium]
MLKVGLTGSIAVGKSFVLGVLRELGARTIDADQIARECVEPGTPGLTEVVKEFGSGVLNHDGSLDRAKLGAVVFAEETKREKLNSILHPFIITRQDEMMRQWEIETPKAIAVVDAALMIESGGYQRFDKLIVVHCEPEVQIERLMKRNTLAREEAERRVKAQMPQEEKMKYADYLIDTSGDFQNTRKQVEELWRELETANRSARDTD